MFQLTLVLLLAGAGTGDWSRFRGPNGTGIQETGRLPAELSATRNVVWKTALPPGYSSPVVSGDRIFVTAFEGEKLLTIALDRATGKERWRRESPRDRREKLDPRNGPASATPVADGKNVYVFFPDYGLVSYTFAGEERWRTPLGPFNNVYGMGASPVLAGDLLVLVCDQNRGSFAVGFRQSDGREVWRTARPDALSGHSTPIVYDPPGGPLQVVAPGSFRMDNYSAGGRHLGQAPVGLVPHVAKALRGHVRLGRATPEACVHLAIASRSRWGAAPRCLRAASAPRAAPTARGPGNTRRTRAASGPAGGAAYSVRPPHGRGHRRPTRGTTPPMPRCRSVTRASSPAPPAA